MDQPVAKQQFQKRVFDLDAWQERLRLFDPDHRLTDALRGMDEIMRGHSDRIFDLQCEVCRRDPRLAGTMNAEALEMQRKQAAYFFNARFTHTNIEEGIPYLYNFGKMLAAVGARMTTGLAIVSVTFAEAMRIAADKLEGERLIEVMQALQTLTAIESDIISTAMNDVHRENYRASLQSQAKTFEDRVLGTVKILGEQTELFRASTQKAGVSSRKLLDASSAVAASAQQSASAMGEAERSVGFLGGTIEKVGKSARHTELVSSDTAEKAVASAVSAKQLADSSAKVKAIVKMIQKIADQTQLLALNASIEASRAGESGAGFAVVAGEVKHLANETRDATQEISTQVLEMIAATKSSAELAEKISESISEIKDSASGVETQVADQIELVQAITDAVSETFMSAEHVSKEVAAIGNEANDVAKLLGDVDEKFSLVDQLLGQLENDTRSYRQSFDRLADDFQAQGSRAA
ncbi:methyl-accepting chemotaxis protein [Parapontixanthobacter aurantiacus]|nr:methyl-accepting chemotaxis protein [Parapontixanthobacter aurantiacus]